MLRQKGGPELGTHGVGRITSENFENRKLREGWLDRGTVRPGVNPAEDIRGVTASSFSYWASESRGGALWAVGMASACRWSRRL